MKPEYEPPLSRIRDPLATPEAISREPAPFPRTTKEEPFEIGFVDWRERLTSNLSRRSDGRWDPLTWTSARRSEPTDRGTP